MPTINWSDITGQADTEHAVNWSDVVDPARHPYVAQALSNLPGSLAKVGHSMMHPLEDIQGVAGSGQALGQSIKDKGIIETAKAIGQHIYDKYGSVEKAKAAFAADPAGEGLGLATLLVGGPEAALAKGTKAGIAATDVARVASLPERIAALPEKPLTGEVLGPLSPTERATQLKQEAGAGMQAAKEAET